MSKFLHNLKEDNKLEWLRERLEAAKEIVASIKT